MTYYLTRERDGAGDAGGLSVVLNWENNLSKPTVGFPIRVGSVNHWWTTTPISEIIEEFETDGELGRFLVVKFKTVNGSNYVWKMDV